jgi:hypothetical protein
MSFFMANSMVKEPFPSEVRMESRLVGPNLIFPSDLGKRERISGTNDPISIKSTPLDSP